jgi:hypothetical protein
MSVKNNYAVNCTLIVLLQMKVHLQDGLTSELGHLAQSVKIQGCLLFAIAVIEASELKKERGLAVELTFR